MTHFDMVEAEIIALMLCSIFSQQHSANASKRKHKKRKGLDACACVCAYACIEAVFVVT